MEVWSLCALCGMGVASNLERHRHLLRSHVNEANYCSICSKPYDHERTLNQHIKRSHPHSNILKLCQFCQKDFALEHALMYHQDEFHENELQQLEKPYLCPLPYCQKKFQDESFLGVHLLKHPIESRSEVDVSKYPVNCSLSSTYRKRKSSVKRRKTDTKDLASKEASSQSGKDMGQCSICGDLVPASNMPLHLKDHLAPKLHKCDLCGKDFAKMATLNDHRLSIHEKRELPCPYEDCTKVFFLRGVLRKHIQGVHLQTRFQCNLCRKSFSLKGDLKVHVKGVHEGVRLTCSLCNREFTRASDRNRHERDVHGVRRPSNARGSRKSSLAGQC